MIDEKLTKNLQEQITKNKNDIANIIESGTGYIKYSDGTMICYGQITKSSTSFSAWANIYGGVQTVNNAFPKQFIDIPVVTITSNNLGAVYEMSVDESKIISLSLLRATTSNGSLTANYIAIGKWKN